MSEPLNRRGINVSEYIQSLNTLPSADEQVIDLFNPDDLDIWTNTQFFDFDMGQIAEAPAATQHPTKDHHQPTTISPIDPDSKDNSSVEFDHLLHELKELDGYHHSCTPPTSAFVDYSKTEESKHISEIQPPLPSPSGSLDTSAYPLLNTSLPISAIQSTPIYTTPQSLKRKASFDDPSSHIPETLEDASRIAAEEDKRRRNTAASARFRVKKKQKEQQLEKTAKEMTDRVSQLEQENQQLKVENKWLKNLLVEKNEVKNGQEKNLPLSPSIHTSISKDGKGAIAD